RQTARTCPAACSGVRCLTKEENRNLTVYRYNFPVRINELTEEETATINIVTAGLADYRGYDTMGEETVILTGAIGVILLLRRRGRL
ncbi:MAG TPA: hypothetical protein PLY74_13150, partial [Methanothrix soehngenii]|nr:hypothetical protein [Methanothrix soehngenii]HPL21920.1 hypothetical protein [Methanothrix soehngenii]